MQRPGVTLGEALAELEKIAAEILPSDVQLDYTGTSRQFKQEGSAMLYTFGFALIVIYLVLAAQFESFRDPLIMLVSVPMSICGALLFLNLFAIIRLRPVLMTTAALVVAMIPLLTAYGPGASARFSMG